MRIFSAMLSLFLLTASPIINYNAGKEAKSIQTAWGWVKGYVRKDGTYVSGYIRDTSNDGNCYNNVNGCR